MGASGGVKGSRIPASDRPGRRWSKVTQLRQQQDQVLGIQGLHRVSIESGSNGALAYLPSHVGGDSDRPEWSCRGLRAMPADRLDEREAVHVGHREVAD